MLSRLACLHSSAIAGGCRITPCLQSTAQQAHLASRSNSVSVSSVAVARLSVDCCNVRLLSNLKGSSLSSPGRLVLKAIGFSTFDTFCFRTTAGPVASCASSASSAFGCMRLRMLPRRCRFAKATGAGAASVVGGTTSASAILLTHFSLVLCNLITIERSEMSTNCYTKPMPFADYVNAISQHAWQSYMAMQIFHSVLADPAQKVLTTQTEKTFCSPLHTDPPSYSIHTAACS